MLKYHRYLFVSLIALSLGFRLGTIVLVRPAPAIDEPLHLKAAQQFGPGPPSIAQLRDYHSATGPFFYVMFGNLGALLGYNLTLLRLAVFVLALGNLLLFYRVLKRLLPTDNPLPAVALLATAPHFLALAGMFMTDHLALFLGLAALLCHLRFHDLGGRADAVLSLLSATLAVYTRSYFIFLPAAFAAADVVGNPSRWPRALLWLAPILAFLPIALLWRGLAPPTFQSTWHPGFQWQNASSLFIWTGIFILPWVWSKLRPWHLLALLAIPMVLRAPLPGLGITRSALKLLPRSLALIAACVFGVIGLLWLIQLTPMVSKPESRLAAAGALLLAAGLLVSGPSVFERYLLPGIPLMIICARPGTRPRLALAWADLFQFPLAVAHILHLAA